VPADGNSAATEGNGDFGTSPIFWAALGQATAFLYLGQWGAGRKAQYAIENFSAGLSRFDMERLLGRRMAGIDEWIAHGFRSDLECWSSILVRLFMIQHDCGHGSFFHNRSANDWVGRVIGVHTLTPYDLWLIRKAAQMSLVGRPFVLASSAQLIQKSFFEPTARSFPTCIGMEADLPSLDQLRNNAAECTRLAEAARTSQHKSLAWHATLQGLEEPRRSGQGQGQAAPPRDPGARGRDRARDRRVPQDRAHGAEGRARGAPGQEGDGGGEPSPRAATSSRPMPPGGSGRRSRARSPTRRAPSASRCI
jgi:hypothetical protein